MAASTQMRCRLALTKLVEIVGEAAKQVTAEGRVEIPDVSLSAAARTRDRLIVNKSVELERSHLIDKFDSGVDELDSWYVS